MLGCVPYTLCGMHAGNNRAVAAALQSGVGTNKAVSFWLYNMLSQPLSSDQLLIRGSSPTQLSGIVNSSRYDLRFAVPAGLRSSEVRSWRRLGMLHACALASWEGTQPFLRSKDRFT